MVYGQKHEIIVFSTKKHQGFTGIKNREVMVPPRNQKITKVLIKRQEAIGFTY